MTSPVRHRPPLAELLGLQPHPEGGWYRRTWTSPEHAAMPAGSAHRRAASAIYYLLQAGERSAWHKVASDELWLWHHGGPLTMALGGTGDQPAEVTQTFVLGCDLEKDQHPQIVVPGGTWQRATPAGTACLVTCVVSPEFHFDDFQLHAQPG
jgi:uncharacterized protein